MPAVVLCHTSMIRVGTALLKVQIVEKVSNRPPRTTLFYHFCFICAVALLF